MLLFFPGEMVQDFPGRFHADSPGLVRLLFTSRRASTVEELLAKVPLNDEGGGGGGILACRQPGKNGEGTTGIPFFCGFKGNQV